MNVLVTDPMIVPPVVLLRNLDRAVAEAVNVLVAMIVPSVVPTIVPAVVMVVVPMVVLARIVSVRGYESEGKWMSLFRYMIFCVFCINIAS